MFRIIFHRSKCIGCNACVEAAPERWRVSRKDGKCNLIASIEKKGIHQVKLSMVEFDQNKIAATNCPVNIISLQKIK